jgi:hypothetical protein
MRTVSATAEITNPSGVTAAAITTALQGAEADPERIGAEYLPDALTLATGDPTTDAGITISGIVTPSAANGFYAPAGLVNGYPSYAKAGYKLFRTTVTYTWMLTTDTVPLATNKFVSTDNVPTPGQVTTWTPISVSVGVPLIAGQTPIGTTLGQSLQVLDTGAWYKWDGEAWELEAADLTAGPVRSTAGTSSIADGALSIAKTSGLQTALDGKGTSLYLQNLSGINKVFADFMQFDAEQNSAAPVRIGYTGFGDSMIATNGGLQSTFQIELAAKYGWAGICSTSDFGLSYNGAAWTLAGGAAKVDTFSRLPSGVEFNLPEGGTATQTLPSTISGLSSYTSGTAIEARLPGTSAGSPHFPKGILKVSVFYIKEVGAGSITATLSQDQLADVTSGAVSANAVESLGRIDLTPADAFGGMTLQLAASGDAVRFIGAVYWGHSGVLFWTSAKGGSQVSQQAACLSAGAFKSVYQSLATELNTSFVLHAQRGGDEPLEGMEDFFDAYDSLGLPQIVFSEPTRASENPIGIAAINAYLQSECAARNYVYFDRNAAVNAATEAALGWTKIGGNKALTVNHTTDTFTYNPTSTTLANGDTVYFGATTMPAGLFSGKRYYVIGATSTTFQVSETKGGIAVNFTSDGTTVVVYFNNTVDLHQNVREHRYTLGRFFNEVGWFASALSQKFFSPITQSGLNAERLGFQIANQSKETILLPVQGRTSADATLRLWGAAVTTYANPDSDPLYGFNFPSTAAIGNGRGTFGALRAGASTFDPVNEDFVVSGSGATMNLPAGVQAYLLFGTSSAAVADPTTYAGIAQKCFGLEFAKGSDVSASLTANAIYVRIFWTDASVKYNSRWVQVSTSSEAISAAGWSFALHWDRKLQMFILWCDSNIGRIRPRLSVYATTFNASTTGQYASGTIRASNYDFGNGVGATATPATTGRMAVQVIRCNSGRLSPPYDRAD